MYDLLLQEYSQEKSVKEEAKKHSLKYTQKRSISLEDKEEEEKQKEQEEEEPDEFEDTVFIKNTSLSASTPEAGQKEEKPAKEEAGGKEEEKADEVKPSREQEAQKTTAAEEEKTQKKSPEEEKTKEKPAEKSEEKAPEAEAVPEEEKQDNEVKILGKIDLESIEPKKSKSKKATTTKKESARKKETKEQPAAEKPQQQKEKETSQKQAGEKQPQKQPAKAKQPEKEPAKSEPEKQARKKATPKKETPPKAKGEQKPKPASKAGKKEETVEQKAEPKTQPSAPKKEKASEKTQKSAEKEQPQKPAAKPQAESEQKQKAPEKEAPKEKAKEEDNFIKTQVEKLDGPKILGTIDLSDHTKKTEKKRPEKKKDDRKRKQERKKPADKKQPAKEGEKTDEKRKPVASSKDESIRPKKKRRKRIKPEPAQQQEGKGKRGPQEGKADKRQQRGKPTKKTVSKVKKPQRHEPSEEEVQKQLKETMARLSEGGKKKSVKHRRTKRDAIKKKEQEQADEEKNIIKVTEFVTVNELANMMDANVNQVISTCMSLGLFVSINQRLDAETINLVADEFGYDVEFVSVEVQEALEEQEAEEETPDEGNLESRAPIITVMGHVDHGKTSLLDHIRQANVIGAESGGITQHIGAYEVETQSGKKITFLDTPGHEAFTAMRARGAQITDIAIIIIAADDQIMPQTIEAINHAQAAGVTIVFAINKIDKPGANPDKIREQLSHRDILVEEWGGKYQSQEISAKKGDGIEELLERVLLEAELLELKGNPNKKAKGTVIESALDKGRGYVANLLVQDGTLKKGDYVLAGAHSGKVRAMYNERNQQVQQVGPSTPVLMLGLDGAPQAGDQFNVFEDEREAKELANKRRQLQREQGIRTQKHVTLDEIGRRIAIGDFKELNVIVKGDVDGSVEALADALLKLGNQEVQVNVIHKSVGQISESDVMLASASEAIIVGFQVRPSSAARKLAEKEQIDIRTYSVIYKAIEEVKAAIEGMLAPKIEEKVVCNLEVRDTFKIKKVGTVAGCKVLDGIINRNTKVRIIRDGIVIHTGELGSLKRYKDDVKEVKAGYECGLNLKNFNDIKPGDIIEGFKEVEVERKLGE
ncbi:MAG: translation initiation factor IF-2 [Bacteroidales bacterium]|nr:translation initiation factor IF-2 [Bacteroidales bacterium]MCF8332874.1 translation initiation factor IF-2 [Bacteroidales bacterium]